MGRFAEAVECPRLTVAVFEQPEGREGLPVVVGREVGSAEAGVGRADAVQRPCHAGPVTVPPEQFQCLTMVLGGLLVPAQPGLDVTKVRECDGLAAVVAELPEQLQRPLVVFDNVATADDVRPLAVPGPSCHTVVTSRDRLAGLVARDGAQRLNLDVPPVHEAVDLLRCLVGDQVATDPVAAAAMVTRCGRSPLVLRLVAEFVAARPGVRLREVLDELTDPPRLLDALSAGGDPRAGLDAVLSWSYRRLAAGEAMTFRALGRHPGPDVGLHTAAALTGSDPPTVRSALGRLAGASLLRPTGPDRYALPEPLRTYARQLTVPESAPRQ